MSRAGPRGYLVQGTDRRRNRIAQQPQQPGERNTAHKSRNPGHQPDQGRLSREGRTARCNSRRSFRVSRQIVASRRARSASVRFLVSSAWSRTRWVAGSEQLFPKLPQGIVVI